MNAALLLIRWLVEVALLGGGLVYVARRVGGRDVWLLTLGTFTFRCLTGEALYAISALHLPVLRNLQLPNGFWAFGPDAVGYDTAARPLAENLLHGGSKSSILHGFAGIVGLIYSVFGSNPSPALAFNAACAAACVPLGYVIAQQAGMRPKACLLGAGLIGFWPSSFAWSGQLLKDPLQWLGSFAFLAGAAILLSNQPFYGRGRYISGIALMLAGGLITAMLRSYVVAGWALGLTIALIIFVARNWSQNRRLTLLSGGVVLAILSGGAIVSFRSVHTYAPTSVTNVAAMSAAELAVWDANPDIQEYFRSRYPNLSPINAMDEWIAFNPPEFAAAGSDIIRYAKQLTGRDFSNGVYPEVPAHGPLACPTLAPVLFARARFSADGGASLTDGDQQFENCADVIAYVPRSLQLVFLFPLPDGWTSGRSVGSARYLSALDALLLWLTLPGLVVGAVYAFGRSGGVNAAIAVAMVVLGIGLGFVVTNFGTLFRLRLEVILPAMLLAADGWLLIAAVARSRLNPGIPSESAPSNHGGRSTPLATLKP